MRTLSAIVLGKSIGAVLRKFNLGGGSAAPGLYGLKLDPELVQKLSSKIPGNIVITGTNGKTTTSRLLAHFAKQKGLKVIRNHTGSNLERGIASTLIQNYGKKFDLGIWELDEAAFNTVAPKIKPDIVVFLNISRDQLDRYGEIDKVVAGWCRTVAKLDPKTIVLINADDENLQKVEKHFKGKVVKFGKKDIKNIRTNGLNGSIFQLIINHKPLTINLPLPGLYHIYDALAALVIAHYLSLPSHNASLQERSDVIASDYKSFQDFQPAFGRFEKLPFGYIFLIKNPAGATQVFETITPNIKKEDRLLLALNDNIADGTDVSWIWDANFEVLQNLSRAKSRDYTIYASGTRTYDLANRLKYAGFPAETLYTEPDLKKALQKAKEDLKGRLFILPTYTAMLELQRILARSGLKRHYWEEES